MVLVTRPVCSDHRDRLQPPGGQGGRQSRSREQAQGAVEFQAQVGSLTVYSTAKKTILHFLRQYRHQFEGPRKVEGNLTRAIKDLLVQKLEHKVRLFFNVGTLFVKILIVRTLSPYPGCLQRPPSVPAAAAAALLPSGEPEGVVRTQEQPGRRRIRGVILEVAMQKERLLWLCF